MGYDLHITRAELWAENEGAEITAEEWRAVVESDPELTFAPEVGEHFAIWSGPSRHAQPWLGWSDGNVYTKYPDSALLRKMVVLAERLGARVQGDDGEWYTGDEPLDAMLDAADDDSSPSGGPASWWRHLIGR